MATEENTEDTPKNDDPQVAPKPVGLSDERAQYIAKLIKGEEKLPHESMTLEYLVGKAHKVQKAGEEVLAKLKSNQQLAAQLQQESEVLSQKMQRHLGAMDEYASDIDEWLRKAEADNLVDLKETGS